MQNQSEITGSALALLALLAGVANVRDIGILAYMPMVRDNILASLSASARMDSLLIRELNYTL